MTTKTILLLATLIGSSAWAAPASAQDNAPSPHLNLGEENLAVQGYDLVAYVEENEARQGNPEHAFTYQGVGYYFVSEAQTALTRSNTGTETKQRPGNAPTPSGMRSRKRMIRRR